MDKKYNLENDGYCKFDSIINKDWLTKINDCLPEIFVQHEKIRRQNKNPISSNGIALNALVGSDLLLEFLTHLVHINLIDWIEENYFKGKCILNSFSALSNNPEEDKVFHRNYHRDIRGFSSEIPIMLNMLVMLDDFTIENGATLLLPKSHLEKSCPTEKYFKEFSIPAFGNAGDVIIWNSNLFHASGYNKTEKARRALPITFSLPYYKQLLDYPRAFGEEKSTFFDNETKRILGYDSRVPESLSDWYAPIDKILYRN